MKFLLRFFKWVLSLFVKKEIQEQEVMSALDRLEVHYKRIEKLKDKPFDIKRTPPFDIKRTPKEYGHYLQSKGLQKWQRKN